MNIEEFISLNNLSVHHEIEASFFSSLDETGLIHIQVIEQIPHIHRDKISDLEKMIRMHRELNINAEGIDTIFNLLQKINELQDKLISVQNRLSSFEG